MPPEGTLEMWGMTSVLAVVALVLIVRGLSRAYILPLNSGLRGFQRWCWQVFAVGPRIILFTAGILVGLMWSARATRGVSMLHLTLFCLVLAAYVVSEWLQSRFYHPDRGGLLAVEGIAGVWIPLFLSCFVQTCVLLVMVTVP